jgi:hypothetical protein
VVVNTDVNNALQRLRGGHAQLGEQCGKGAS